MREDTNMPILICVALYAAPTNIDPIAETCDWHNTTLEHAVAACEAYAHECIVWHEPRTLVYTVRFEFTVGQ